ncbi:uncharacterized protein J8A68_005257 [[Candida] subhashii]|uniref:RING-type domain-containing protein n=1 Tax=[Candida] subhashii TaxID=561895 RepID=A0A8J5UJM0_9ASCO|nr:uncharacterized protein J8A68_005257 [[Candida] subhashii]KAG7661261.1 hypothetical protein J8A68_005257 [[Candida] subhashii]
MATYEQEHNISESSTPSRTDVGRGRQHETLASIIDTFLQQNTPQPYDTPSNAYAAEALISSLRQLSDENGSGLANMLIESLGDPITNKDGGVPSEFLDTLERINIKDIKDQEEACCPICTNRFLDDKYPLIVRLPCGNGTKHIFDLECIGPWLQMNCTCPLCRNNLLELEKNRRKKIEEEIRKAREEDSEEEEKDWDVYG